MQVNSIRYLECLLAQEAGKEEQFLLTWTSWSTFRYSSEFLTWAKGVSASTPQGLVINITSLPKIIAPLHYLAFFVLFISDSFSLCSEKLSKMCITS